MARLQDLCHLITDGKHGDCENEEGSGFYFISCKDVKDGWIDYSNARQITERDFRDTHRRTQLEVNDIIITNSGTIGRMALVKSTPETARTTFQKSVAIIKPNIEKVIPHWLYYYLKANKDALIAWAGGTAQKNLLLRDLRAFQVQIAPIPIQRKIAAILSAYDDLIENNTRRIKILEEMAQLIYREWFVKFSFPGHEKVKMVNSELGPIPEGWEVIKLGEIIEFQKGKKVKNVIEEQCDGFIPYLLIDGLKNYQYVYTDDKKIPVAYETDCIMVMDGASSGYVSIGHYGAVGSTLAKIIIKGNLNSYYLYQFLQFNYKIISDNNTGSAIPHANKDFIKGMFIPIPPMSLMRIYIDYIEPIFRLTWKLRKKNTILRRTRDLLLPKLISGELDVEDLDIAVGGD